MRYNLEMKKILFLLLFSSLSLFATQKVVLQLSWLHQYQFAGYYAAKELGYYKDAGIDLEIKEIAPHTNLSTVIQDKEADFAIGRSSLLIDKIEGKDIVALGAIFQQSPMMLLVKDDSGINSVKDLKNRRIMLTDDAKETASVMAMLFSNGLSQKNIQIMPHTFNLDDLINGNTDAMASYISNEPVRLADRGIGYRIFHPSDYGFHFYSDILFTSSQFIHDNPKLTDEFYQATIKGWEYAFDHIYETAELIQKSYNTQNKTLLQLIKEGEILKHLAYYQGKPLGYLDKARLGDIVKVYNVLGIVTQEIDLDTFIYEYNHPPEVKFALGYDDIFYISIIAVLLLIGLGSMIIFVSLKKQWLHTHHHLNEKIASQKEKINRQNGLIMAQSKLAAVGEMLSNIAHQWRQPLNIITLNTVKMETSLLLGNTLKDEDIQQITTEINRQAQYLSKTIDDFRSYFNADIKSVAPFNLKDAINKANELTKDLFASHYIETVITADDCILTHNESLFIQSLLNIYNNSIDAITQSKAKYRYFFVDLRCDGDNALLSIKDSGGGIDKDVIEKIFEPYFTTKHASKGTGLGLYITYEIITKHLNGTIEVSNKNYRHMDLKLKGAEFLIKLPLIP